MDYFPLLFLQIAHSTQRVCVGEYRPREPWNKPNNSELVSE